MAAESDESRFFGGGQRRVKRMPVSWQTTLPPGVRPSALALAREEFPELFMAGHSIAETTPDVTRPEFCVTSLNIPSRLRLTTEQLSFPSRSV